MKLLLDTWKENPESLLSKAYDENLEWCIRYVRKNNGTPDDAADIFQESISVAWLNLSNGKFEGDSEHFNAYIRQICKYKWINELRSNSKNRVLLAEDPSIFESASDTEVIAEETAQMQLLKSSFDSIGDKCRDLLQAFYFKKQSLAFMAKAMNITEGSIKTIKYRCMMRLRKEYLERFKENE